MPDLLSLFAPTMQELQQRLLIRIGLFERLVFDVSLPGRHAQTA